MTKTISQQVDDVLSQVMSMPTQEAFSYLSKSDINEEVVNRVALILKPSQRRTDFLTQRGLVNWLIQDMPEDNDLSGQSIANIQLEKIIGQGGMGTVYKGTDLLLERTVAIKTLQHKFNSNKQSQAHQRFRTEALMLSKIDHPNICRINSLIETKQTDFLVLEYIVGQPLNAEHFSRFSKAQQIDIIKQVLEGLQAAHRKNIIHRDIKPDNILITDKGTIKILDFGISRLINDNKDKTDAAHENQTNSISNQTQAGSILGTVYFMSPEQAMGNEVTTASDLYSFGLLLQTLLSKVSPYPVSTTQEDLLTLSNQGETQIPKDLPHYWIKLIQSLKSYAPADRPTAKEALNQVEAIALRAQKRWKMVGIGIFLLLVVSSTMKYISDLTYERQQAFLAQQKSEQVVKFLSTMFQKSNPYGANGKEFSASDLLEQGSLRIDDELALQIDTKAYLKAIIGDSFMQLGKVDKAKKLLLQAYEAVVKYPSEISQETSFIVRELKASYLLNVAQFSQAKEIFEKLLNEIDSNDELTKTRLQSHLVITYTNLNEFDQSIALALASLEGISSKDKEYDEFKAILYNQLGICHFYQGKYNDAKNYFLSGVNIVNASELNFKGTDIQLLDGLSGAYLFIGDEVNSIKIALETIALAEKILPENHIDLAQYYNNMSLKYFVLKNFQKAKVFNDRSLQVFNVNFGSGLMNDDQVIPLYASTLIAGANILSVMDQLPQALANLIIAKNKLQKVFPTESMELANVDFEIALVRWEINKDDEKALTNLTQSLAIFAIIDQALVGKHLSAHELKIVMQKYKDKQKAQVLLLQLIERLKQENQPERVIENIKIKFSDLLEQ